MISLRIEFYGTKKPYGLPAKTPKTIFKNHEKYTLEIPGTKLVVLFIIFLSNARSLPSLFTCYRCIVGIMLVLILILLNISSLLLKKHSAL